MPPPSKLAVATSSLNRLVKEEASYYKEMEQQQVRIKKLEAGSEDENAEYLLRQEVPLSSALLLRQSDNDIETRPRGDQDGPPNCEDQDFGRSGEARGTTRKIYQFP